MRYITALKRVVSNRWDYLLDAILKYLYDWHDDPFNDDDLPVLPRRIAQDLDLPIKEVKDILRYLEKEDLVDPFREGEYFYRIGVEGIAEVEKNLYL